MENFTNDREITLDRLTLKKELSRADKVKQGKRVLTLTQAITIILSYLLILVVSVSDLLSPLCFVVLLLTVVAVGEVQSMKRRLK